MKSERLPHQAFHPVPLDGKRRLPPADDDPESSVEPPVGSCIRAQRALARPHLGILQDFVELLFAGEPM